MQRERESARAKRNGTDRSVPQSSESEGAWVGADRRDLPVRHRGHTGARAELGLMGRLGLNLPFLFSREFLIAFLFIFSMVSIQIKIKFQIQTKSNMCNNSKNIWGST